MRIHRDADMSIHKATYMRIHNDANMSFHKDRQSPPLIEATRAGRKSLPGQPPSAVTKCPLPAPAVGAPRTTSRSCPCPSSAPARRAAERRGQRHHAPTRPHTPTHADCPTFPAPPQAQSPGTQNRWPVTTTSASAVRGDHQGQHQRRKPHHPGGDVSSRHIRTARGARHVRVQAGKPRRHHPHRQQRRRRHGAHRAPTPRGRVRPRPYGARPP